MRRWSALTTDQVQGACEQLLATTGGIRPGGLYMEFRGKKLPVKPVLSLAYCMAHGLNPGSAPKFSSGDATLNVLSRLGFKCGRLEESVDGQKRA